MTTYNSSNVNVQRDNGNTELIDAVYLGHTGNVKELLQVEGVNVNIENSYGETALIVAISLERKEIINLIIARYIIDIFKIKILTICSFKKNTPNDLIEMYLNKEVFQCLHESTYTHTQYQDALKILGLDISEVEGLDMS